MGDPLSLYPDEIWGKPGFALGPPSPPVGNKLMRMGVSEWSEKFDNNAIVNTALSYNPNAFIGIIRRYSNVAIQEPIPNSFLTSHGSEDLGTGRWTWVSYSHPGIDTINSGAHDATLAAYFASIPPTHTVLFTYLHEVNNGKLGSNTTADFRAATARIWQSKEDNAQDPSKVLVGPILIPADFRSGTHAQYFPFDGRYDFVGADPYRFARDTNDPSYMPDPKTGTAGTPRTMQYIIGQMPSFAAAQGKPMAFGEYGAHSWSSKPNERARWLLETDEFFEANNTIAACYFQSTNGESGPWVVDRVNVYTATENDPARRAGAADPISMQQFADLLAKYKPAGV